MRRRALPFHRCLVHPGSLFEYTDNISEVSPPPRHIPIQHSVSAKSQERQKSIKWENNEKPV